MRRFRRKLVITPLLIAMALMALGLPASAQAVYEQNSSRACCEAQHCSLSQAQNAPDDNADRECCAESRVQAAPEERCPTGNAGPAECSCGRERECEERSCVPAERCCPGSLSGPACHP